jgi:hypothetical protein
MMAGNLEVELVPQGTLIERIRAGGHGLGGILTQTGVENGKQLVEVDGKEYLLEVALQFQSGDFIGCGYGHCQRRAYRSGWRYRARPCRDAGTCRRLSHYKLVST